MKRNALKTPAIKNHYYLIVGLLSILFSFTHAQNGKTTVLPGIDKSDIDVPTKTTVHYVWHIITVENLAIGVSFLAMAFYKDSSKVKFTASFIASMMVARGGVIFRSTLLKNVSGLKSIMPDLIAITIYVGLIILGIRKKDKTQKK